LKFKKQLIFCLLALLQACSVPIEVIKTPVELPISLSRTGVATLQEQWWLAFNDAELNQLIDTALHQNYNLLATYNRLQQAQVIAKKSSAALIPSVNTHFNGNKTLSNSRNNSLFSLGLNANYEVDIWGRIRATTHAAELDAQSAEESVKTAAISLSSEIAIAWYRLIEQRRQLQLLNRQIQTNQDNVSLFMARFAGGQSTAADLFQQQQILEASKGNKKTVLATLQVLEHQLAILTGHTPKLIQLPKQDNFPVLPELPKTGLTTEIIQRRPDLRLAYYRVQAADQRIAAAIADRFPKLSLSAGIDTTAPNLQSLFNNWIATLGGNLLLPLIDGGRRVAEVNRTKAVAAEALNNYATAIQQAIKEVEDALSQEQQQQQLVVSLTKQLYYSQQATTQIRLRFSYGAIDFLRVLSLQISQQALERRQILAQRQLIEYRIHLYRALAGGWAIQPIS